MRLCHFDRGTKDVSVGVAPHAVAGDLHLPRSTMDVTVPGMAATTARSAQCQSQGLLRIPSTSGAATAGGGGGGGPLRQPGTPRKDDVLDDTFIDVSSHPSLECMLHCMQETLCKVGLVVIATYAVLTGVVFSRCVLPSFAAT